MTKKQKLHALKSWAKVINESNQQIDALHKVTGMCDGPLIEAIWKLQDALTDAVAAQVGDAHETLDWYRNDNGMGAKGYEAGIAGDMRAIKTEADLLWLIGASA